MREAVARRASCSVEGLPLSGMVDRRLALDIDLFSRGGMRVLDKIQERRLRRALRASRPSARPSASACCSDRWQAGFPRAA